MYYYKRSISEPKYETVVKHHPRMTLLESGYQTENGLESKKIQELQDQRPEKVDDLKVQ